MDLSPQRYGFNDEYSQNPKRKPHSLLGSSIRSPRTLFLLVKQVTKSCLESSGWYLNSSLSRSIVQQICIHLYAVTDVPLIYNVCFVLLPMHDYFMIIQSLEFYTEQGVQIQIPILYQDKPIIITS